MLKECVQVIAYPNLLGKKGYVVVVVVECVQVSSTISITTEGILQLEIVCLRAYVFPFQVGIAPS